MLRIKLWHCSTAGDCPEAKFQYLLPLCWLYPIDPSLLWSLFIVLGTEVLVSRAAADKAQEFASAM